MAAEGTRRGGRHRWEGAAIAAAAAAAIVVTVPPGAAMKKILDGFFTERRPGGPSLRSRPVDLPGQAV